MQNTTSSTSSDSAVKSAPSLVWKSRPIFISSTFRDMGFERDWLRDRAFKRLGEQLLERCHYLDTIDLRQGVENVDEHDEAKRELQVLKVCLDEIQRSKPFLVALLGDRYGWIPPPERITAAARDAGLPTAVQVEGKSVTELEILYGVLENPDQRKRSWFYFRTVVRSGMPSEVAERFPSETPNNDPGSPAGRLIALKARIRREMPDRVREYTLRWDPSKKAVVGLDDLDAKVASDLWGDLATETAAFLRDAPKTWQEADARGLTDFVAERLRGYVNRPAVTDPMLDFAISPSTAGASDIAGVHRDKTSPLSPSEWGMAVTGESGCGKSSLFARTYESLRPRAEAGELLLLSHAAGIFPQSGSVDRMLKRWIVELAAFLNVPDPIASLEGEAVPSRSADFRPVITSEQINQTFASLLGQAAAKTRVVVLIDALNQFEPTVRAQHLTWLPKFWPANARFLATAIPCDASSTLAVRPGCRTLPVPSVTEPEAREIARRFYRERFHRVVNHRVLDTLITKTVSRSTHELSNFRTLEIPSPAYSNPLWLSLALQEMNLLEADDYVRAEQDYPGLPGAEQIQALQLDEARKLPADIPGVYGELLARAERGFGKTWTDAFVNLIAVSRSGWRESDLEALMPIVSGQPWESLAFAGLRRIFGPHVVQRGAHAQWDVFHAALRDTILRRNLADENARKRLHGIIVDNLETLPSDDALSIAETMFHLIHLQDSERAAAFLNRMRNVDDHDNPSILTLVDSFCATHTEAEHLKLVVWITSLLKGHNDRTSTIAGVIIGMLCPLLNERGSLSETLLLSVIKMLERDPQRVAPLSNDEHMLISSHMLHKPMPSDTGLGTIVEIKPLKNPTPLSDGAESAHTRNDGDAVIGILSKSLLRKRLASCYELLGDCYSSQRIWNSALSAYVKSIELEKNAVIGIGLPALVARNVLIKIADTLFFSGQYATALDVYNNVLQENGPLVGGRVIVGEDFGDSSKRFVLAKMRIGEIQCCQGDNEGAMNAFQAALAGAESRVEELKTEQAQKTPMTDAQNQELNRLLAAGGGQISDELSDALQRSATRSYSVGQTIEDWIALSAQVHCKIGDLLSTQNHLVQAILEYQLCAEGLESNTVKNPNHVGWLHDFFDVQGKLGDLLLEQCDYGASLSAYRSSLTVTERLTAADPSNKEWQRDLLVTYWRLAGIAEKSTLGDAQAWWRKAYTQIYDMKRRGILLPTDEQHLEALRIKAEGGDLPIALTRTTAENRQKDGTCQTRTAALAVDPIPLAIAHLKSSKPQEAMNQLRHIVFPNECLTMDQSAPLSARLAFIQALWLEDNVDGVEKHLCNIQENTHPHVIALLKTLAEWQRGLSWIQKAGLKKRPPLPKIDIFLS